jgi:sec-independent protein translocase protein TatC
MAESEQEQEQEQENHDPKEQSLVSHLVELRDRLLRCLMVVLFIFLCLFAFSQDIYTFVSSPLTSALEEVGGQMIATTVTGTFFAPFKLTLVLSVFIAIPFLLHQIWAFIAPGLYKNEINIAFPILVSSIILFYTGVAFAFFIVFQFVFGFFAGIAPDGVIPMTDISSYLSFVLTLFFAFGITFEIPIATILLIFSGVTTPDKLVAKRPYIIIGCFFVGMIMTPADPFTQSMLAIPMWMLFEAGIVAGRILHKPDEDETEDNIEDEADASSSE